MHARAQLEVFTDEWAIMPNGLALWEIWCGLVKGIITSSGFTSGLQIRGLDTFGIWMNGTNTCCCVTENTTKWRLQFGIEMSHRPTFSISVKCGAMFLWVLAAYCKHLRRLGSCHVIHPYSSISVYNSWLLPCSKISEVTLMLLLWSPVSKNNNKLAYFQIIFIGLRLPNMPGYSSNSNSQNMT